MCRECPDQATTTLLSILAGVFLTLLLVMFIRSAISDSSDHADDASKITHLAQSMSKIIINHVQLVSITGSFPLRWPKSIRTIFTIQKILGNVAEYTANPQCQISYQSGPGEKSADIAGRGSKNSLFFEKQVRL